ncbi:MAG TPA: hypothetical protein VE641_08790 [Chthoniobacterales bacterium]|jgi:hypothetical protein|nr:hypothetical protein [Chthoniobacterales bacterium]
MSAFEPPPTPGLAGSALHLRALAPVEHSGHDKPTGEEYKGGVKGVAGVQGAEPGARTRIGKKSAHTETSVK